MGPTSWSTKALNPGSPWAESAQKGSQDWRERGGGEGKRYLVIRCLPRIQTQLPRDRSPEVRPSAWGELMQTRRRAVAGGRAEYRAKQPHVRLDSSREGVAGSREMSRAGNGGRWIYPTMSAPIPHIRIYGEIFSCFTWAARFFSSPVPNCILSQCEPQTLKAISLPLQQIFVEFLPRAWCQG